MSGNGRHGLAFGNGVAKVIRILEARQASRAPRQMSICAGAVRYWEPIGAKISA